MCVINNGNNETHALMLSTLFAWLYLLLVYSSHWCIFNIHRSIDSVFGILQLQRHRSLGFNQSFQIVCHSCHVDYQNSPNHYPPDQHYCTCCRISWPWSWPLLWTMQSLELSCGGRYCTEKEEGANSHQQRGRGSNVHVLHWWWNWSFLVKGSKTDIGHAWQKQCCLHKGDGCVSNW